MFSYNLQPAFKYRLTTWPQAILRSRAVSREGEEKALIGSDDGKTLTMEGTPVGAATFKSVMVRQ